MENNLEKWREKLSEVANDKTFAETLNTLTEAYLESDLANDRKERIKTLWLLRHLKKLF